MQYYILFYQTVPDYLERRTAFRAEHLALAAKARTDGHLVMAGALADPADGAVLVFRGEGQAGAEAARTFAEQDPYVQNGLIASWQVRPWTVVVGG